MKNEDTSKTFSEGNSPKNINLLKDILYNG